MPSKTCVTCNKPFEPEDGRQRRCNDCREELGIPAGAMREAAPVGNGNGNGKHPIAEQVKPFVPGAAPAVRQLWEAAADKSVVRRDLVKLLDEVKIHYSTLEMVLNTALQPLPATEKDMRIQFAIDLMEQSIGRLEAACQ